MAVTEVRFEGYRQPRAARIYARAEASTESRSGGAPVLLFFHDGGFVAGGLDCTDALARALAVRLGVVVVAADYTPAGEWPFPTAVEDAYAALVWIRGEAPRRRWDPRRIAVCGEEAGGNLAAAVAMMARDRGGPALAVQVLVTPMLDPSLTSLSMRDAKPEHERRSPGLCAACYREYLPNAADRMHPYAAPAHATRLQGLAPALILTAADDPLRAEAETYGARLIAAGVKTQVARQPAIEPGAGWPCAWSEAMWSEVVAFLRPLLALPDSVTNFHPVRA